MEVAPVAGGGTGSVKQPLKELSTGEVRSDATVKSGATGTSFSQRSAKPKSKKP